jgi:hypothetical protein
VVTPSTSGLSPARLPSDRFNLNISTPFKMALAYMGGIYPCQGVARATNLVWPCFHLGPTQHTLCIQEFRYRRSIQSHPLCLCRLIIDEYVKNPLVPFHYLFHSFAEMKPKKIVKPAINREDPREVGIQVNRTIQIHCTRSLVHNLRRCVGRCVRRILYLDIRPG